MVYWPDIRLAVSNKHEHKHRLGTWDAPTPLHWLARLYLGRDMTDHSLAPTYPRVAE
jgi:hypothetical protein